MSDTTDPVQEPENFSGLPIQPTGSGVADLEVAYEQMRLAEEAEASPTTSTDLSMDDGAVPTEDTEAAADTAAHPS